MEENKKKRLMANNNNCRRHINFFLAILLLLFFLLLSQKRSNIIAASTANISVSLKGIPAYFNGSLLNRPNYLWSNEHLKEMKEKVKEMFYHAYDSYIYHAFPKDELLPLSCTGKKTWGGYSLTLVDSLDTLLVLGNVTEFERVSNFLFENLDFDMDVNVSVFETNIRVLGSLLSSHLLCLHSPLKPMKNYKGQYLDLALDLGRRLVPAFNTPTGIPYGTVNLKYGVPPEETTVTCTSGAGTFSLEFGILSKLTNDTIFEDVAKKAVKAIWNLRSPKGLLGNHVDIAGGQWVYRDSGIGHGIDSYFEYLVKSGIYFNDEEYLDIFFQSFEGISKYLKKGPLYIEVDMYTATETWVVFNNLQSFFPSIQVLLGDFENATWTTEVFHLIWQQHGFTPEKLHYVSGKPVSGQEGYPLRPELIESIYYMTRAFPNQSKWFSFAEDIINSLEKYCRVQCGYAAINSIVDFSLMDRMDSFFLAETLKYLYLIFDQENWVNKGNYVFNTEAHIFPFLFPMIKPSINKTNLPICPLDSFRRFQSPSVLSSLFGFVNVDQRNQCNLFVRYQPAPVTQIQLPKPELKIENTATGTIIHERTEISENLEKLLSSFGTQIPDGKVVIANKLDPKSFQELMNEIEKIFNPTIYEPEIELPLSPSKPSSPPETEDRIESPSIGTNEYEEYSHNLIDTKEWEEFQQFRKNQNFNVECDKTEEAQQWQKFRSFKDQKQKQTT